MRSKIFPVLMSIVLLLGSFSMAYATEPTVVETGPVEKVFVDMPDNWSTDALNKAVENGLLSGYVEKGQNLIKAENPLTRAEMATVVNRAFASVKTADISKVSDVPASAWHAKEMAKAVKMGTFSYDTKMRPDDKITRQEAFTVLARAFKLVGTDSARKALNAFSDKGEIAGWALDSLDGMAAAGYIQGSGGKLNPKANITRAEFATVMDNLVKQYIDEAGTFTEVVAKGNVVVREADVVLKGVTIKGDLIIADGVGEGDVTLDNIKVEGRTVIRGGGVNSIIIIGGSDLGKVIVAKVDGVVRVYVDGAEVEVVVVDDGSDDVIIEGKIGDLEVVGDGVTVTALQATINTAEVTGSNSRIIVGEGSTINKITIKGPDATIEGEGAVKDVEVQAGGDGASITTPDTKIKNTGAEDVSAAGDTEVPKGQTAVNNPAGDDAKIEDTPPGGGGRPVVHPTITLGNLSYYGDSIVIGESGLYEVPKHAVSSTAPGKIDVEISGEGFDENKVYAIQVRVDRLSPSPESKTAGVNNIPGALLNQDYGKDFIGIQALLDYYAGLGFGDSVTSELEGYLNTQDVGYTFRVTFTYSTSGQSGPLNGGTFEWRIVK